MYEEAKLPPPRKRQRGLFRRTEKRNEWDRDGLVDLFAELAVIFSANKNWRPPETTVKLIWGLILRAARSGITPQEQTRLIRLKKTADEAAMKYVSPEHDVDLNKLSALIVEHILDLERRLKPTP